MLSLYRYRASTGVLLFFLFFATVIGKDYYHLLAPHHTEDICGDRNADETHLHEYAKCYICSYVFSSADDTRPNILAGIELSLVFASIANPAAPFLPGQLMHISGRAPPFFA